MEKEIYKLKDMIRKEQKMAYDLFMDYDDCLEKCTEEKYKSIYENKVNYYMNLMDEIDSLSKKIGKM